MKKLLISLGIFATLQFADAQNITSKKWADHFSYNNVLAMKEDNGKIIAATENGIFYYTIATGEITKLSKANGLHEVKISAFDYNPQTKIGLVGYQNGSLDVITPQGITLVVDIPIATGYNGSKKINHISITGDKAVVSVGYGLSIFDLKKKEFGDSTFFVSTGGVYLASNEATIKDNKVFSVTNDGFKSHEMNTTFPVYSTWTTEFPGYYKHIDSESAIAFSSGNTAYIYNNGVATPVSQSFGNISDLVVNSDNIVITDGARIYTYNTSGINTGNFALGETCNTATRIGSKIYGGTVLSGIKTEDEVTYKPDGPYFNYAYKIRLFNDNQILVSTGIRANGYNDPQINPKNPGFYYFTGTEWLYPSIFKGSSTVFNVIDAFPDPANTADVFFSNYNYAAGYGIYKMKYNSGSKDFDFVKLYDLAAVDPYMNRPVGFTSDEQNNIFSTVSFYNGTSGSIGFYERTTDKFVLKDLSTSAALQYPIYSKDLLWIPIPRTINFVVYDTKKTANISDDTQYLLDQNNGLAGETISFAMDKSGDGWFGMQNGLRILPNAATAVKSKPTLQPIVIEQGGLAEELFRDSPILQIEVDGGNQKWVSVEDGGVYYLSANGEKIIKHFNKTNSPLPTNMVTDIKIDKKTGKVYFVTFDGIVTYQGDVSDVTSDFGNVLVYPNPVVQSQFKGNVTIKGLAEKTNIRITDAAGNLVHSAVARNGYYEWNLNNQRGTRVASGIYFVLMTNEDGSDKATAKIAVVN